jgi:homoserine O-acetyltransferase
MNYYSEEVHGPHEMFELGNFELESGITLPDARLAFKTQGTLNSAKDNAILFPHMWSGTSKSMEIFIGEDRPLDPSKYFIILRPVRQRLLVVARQLTPTVQQRSVPERHDR